MQISANVSSPTYQPLAPPPTASTGGVGAVDFTSMTPNQMKTAAQALVASGKIDSNEGIRMELAGMPLGTLVNGQFSPLTAAQQASYADTPVNYVQLFQGNLARERQDGYAAAAAADQTILNAMQGAEGGVSGVDIKA